MGVKLDDTLNSKGEEGFITKPDSKIAPLLVPTDEELMISRDIEAIKSPRTKRNFEQKSFIIGVCSVKFNFGTSQYSKWLTSPKKTLL